MSSRLNTCVQTSVHRLRRERRVSPWNIIFARSTSLPLWFRNSLTRHSLFFFFRKSVFWCDNSAFSDRFLFFFFFDGWRYSMRWGTRFKGWDVDRAKSTSLRISMRMNWMGIVIFFWGGITNRFKETCQIISARKEILDGNLNRTLILFQVKNQVIQ